MRTTQFRILIAVIALCLLLTSCMQQPAETQPTAAPTTEPTTQPTTEPVKEPEVFGEGWYTVGKQFPAGQYVFFPDRDGIDASVRIQRGAETVISWTFSGQFFWNVQDGDTVSVSKGHLMNAEGYVAQARADGSYGPGLYRVGIDIPEGCYLVTPDNSEFTAFIKLFATISENQVTDMDWDILQETVIDATGQGAVFLLHGSMVFSEEEPELPPPTTVPPTEPATEPPTQPTEPLLAQIEGNFTAEDVAFFDEFFAQKGGNNGPGAVNYYNRIMSIYDFSSPEEVNVKNVFYDQDIDENWELTEAETEFLSKQESIALGLDVTRVSSGKVDRILQECFGLSLEEMGYSGSWVYFPDTDCYYHSKGDTHQAVYEIKGGTWLEDGRVEIYYIKERFMDMTMTLQKVESGYHVVSNVVNGMIPLAG